MRETREKIEARIKGEFAALRSNFDELETKVKSATDWRQLFARHPGTMVAAAFGAGALLAVMSGRRNRSPGQAVSSAERHASASPLPASDQRHNGVARQIWDPLKEALIGVAVTRATGMLEQLLGSAHEEPKNKGSAKTGSLPDP